MACIWEALHSEKSCELSWEAEQSSRSIPAPGVNPIARRPGELHRAVVAICQVTPQQLQRSQREPARALFAYLARDRAGLRLRDLTEILGVRYAMVSKLVAAGRRLGQTPWGKKCMADIQIRLQDDREGPDRK